MSSATAIDASADRIRVRIEAGSALADAGPALAALREALAASPTAKVEMDLTALTAQDEAGGVLTIALAQACRDARRALTWEGGHAGLADALTALNAPAHPAGAAEGADSLCEQVGRATVDFAASCRDLVTFIGELVHAFGGACRRPRLVRWRDVLYYMDRCGTDGLPITVLICFLMGLILAIQAANQMHPFGADIYVANLIGVSITWELGPLMVGIICTGRAGSAFAAEIGTMKVSEELDALVTMGIAPTRFLVVPKVLALIVVMPLLTVFGDLAGVAGGFVVGMFQLDLPFIAYWNQTVAALGPWDVVQGLIKSAVFAFLVAAVGCLRGAQTREGAQGVGVSTTSAVVSGIFLLIVSDAFMTFLLTRLG
ncbi:MAG: putative phospholipid ABC transporter permease protein MlaE [Lentisphaerae bacterium ADurb.BinA184]|nr:MAG: putative phospholipid ABC transporter permease protein MlaE [Lentisphaerae bacterium ADurb.BinA184]